MKRISNTRNDIVKQINEEFLGRDAAQLSRSIYLPNLINRIRTIRASCHPSQKRYNFIYPLFDSIKSRGEKSREESNIREFRFRRNEWKRITIF